MSKPSRIAVVRNWTERHAHKTLKLAEDEQGRIWLRLEDLRQWMPGLHKPEVLAQRHPGMVRLADTSSGLYLEASTFAWLTKKSTSDATLKLAAWLDANVVGQARRRQEWEDYRGEHHLGIPGELLLADPQAGTTTLGRTQVRSAVTRPFDPRVWTITAGAWSIRRTLIAGFVLSFIAVLASFLLDAMAFDVRNNYVVWTWVSIAVSFWAIVWNGAWMIGAIRSSVRRMQEGLNPWLTSIAMVISLFWAIWMAFLTLQNSSMLLETWWAIYGERDKPVIVLVTRADERGTPTRMLLKGRIGMGSYRALDTALRQHPSIKEIELSSPGGLVIEGFAMTDRLVSAKLNTIVRERCHSACSHMFLAGIERLVAPEAKVGFHRSSSIFKTDFSEGLSAADMELEEWMKLRGVQPDFIEQAMATPGSKIFVVPPQDLVRANVATSVADSL